MVPRDNFRWLHRRFNCRRGRRNVSIHGPLRFPGRTSRIIGASDSALAKTQAKIMRLTSNISVKNAPFGRWTAQKRAAFYLKR